MIVPDVNLLLYAHIDSYDQHPLARVWWRGLANGDEPVGLALPVLFGFVRIATNPRAYRDPLTVAEALGCVEGWLGRPHVRPLLGGARHVELSFGLLRAVGAAANLTTDAQIAALAIEHQAEVHTADADFARFPGVRWSNPLVAPNPARGRPRKR